VTAFLDNTRVTATAEALIATPNGPPGSLVGIRHRNRTVVAAAGVCNSGGDPLTTETIFDLASLTKIAVTTTILRLATLGSLRWDDLLGDYLPGTACHPDTTLRDLLTHRAGLWEWQPLYLANDDPWCALNRLPLRYRPRTARHYSDLGFLLAGRVIEKVTGMHLADAMRQFLTEPLGMSHTGYGPVRGLVAASSRGDAIEREMVASGSPYPMVLNGATLGQAEFPWRERELIGEVNDGNCAHAFGGVAGHAGLFGTAHDLLVLASALATAAAPPDRVTTARSGAPELWSRELTVDTCKDGPDLGQALGWRSRDILLPEGVHRLLWHPGFTGVAVGFIPDADIALVMLTNRLLTPHPVPTDELWQRVCAGLLGATPHVASSRSVSTP